MFDRAATPSDPPSHGPALSHGSGVHRPSLILRTAKRVPSLKRPRLFGSLALPLPRDFRTAAEGSRDGDVICALQAETSR